MIKRSVFLIYLQNSAYGDGSIFRLSQFQESFQGVRGNVVVTIQKIDEFCLSMSNSRISGCG